MTTAWPGGKRIFAECCYQPWCQHYPRETGGDPLQAAAKRVRGTLEIVAPMPPPLTNSGKGRSRHWRVLEQEKARYWDLCDSHRQVGLIPPPPAKPLERVRIASVMHVGAANDDDNAMARHKWLIDWLRRERYIADDRKRNIEWAGLPRQEVKRGQQYRIVLTITPVAA